jgi:peptidoglycan-N-acetylglucosamine deacetylase
MIRLAQFRTFSALRSVVMAIVLALFLLLLSQSVSQAAKRPSTGDKTPPTVSTVAPANNATGVAVVSNVEATFSEAMNASTINTSTFTLVKTGTTTPVAAQVSYDPATTKATLDPQADLDPGATYTATVKGGKKGVKDLAGNGLRSDSTWSFTTAAAPPPPDTTLPDTTIDFGPSATATSTSSSASFTFSSSEPNSTFECQLDDEAYSSCTSPKSYSALADGSHTFYVRAIDAAGNVDPTPASQTWMIDTTSAPPPNSKLIALTFDDGPDPANTPTILDILQRNNVKATFFVVGRQVNYHPHLVRREYQEGHMVGNHSYTHPDLTKLSSAGVEKELRDTNTAITSAGVPQPNLFRPPYGATNAQVESTAASLGMTQTLWEPSQSIEDWTNPPPAEICDRAVRDAKPGAILGLHDAWTTNTDDALECIITRLKAEGYSFGQIYPSSTYNSLNRSYVEIR